MCGIFAVFNKHEIKRHEALKLSKLLRHRGPDSTGIFEDEKTVICQERLAIVDPECGQQPFCDKWKTLVLAVNGEIYNHQSIREELEKKGRSFLTGSDCEVFIHLYAEYGGKFMEALPVNGMFAFVLYDSIKGCFVIGRDRVGIMPLYYGYGRNGSMWVASELKAIIQNTTSHYFFPPGHIYESSTGKMRKYCTPRFLLPNEIPTQKVELSQIRDALIESVRTHLMADVPFGVLLSGGLDSSLVASIMTRFLNGSLKGGPKNAHILGKLNSYSIGLDGSPDLAAAKLASQFLGTQHHGYTVTVQEMIDAVDDVIYHLETYDVTTIRASTPMFLMSRMIKATGVKMVLSGEGADEIFGGYLYFHKCPNAEEMHKENCFKVSQLHYYDCLRANKSMMAWGLEVRVPFLDNEFLEFAMGFDPSMKLCGGEEKRAEKYILRAAFDVRLNGEGKDAKPWLPDEILWRQKEQFSDGVGYNWIDNLKLAAEEHVTDRMMRTVQYRFPLNTPGTKEAYFDREIFEKHFPGDMAASTVLFQASIACSTMRALQWSIDFQNREDCSGRSILNVHENAYDENWDKTMMSMEDVTEVTNWDPKYSDVCWWYCGRCF